MANALRLHPLLVIFGLLAGGELYGIAGVLMALPTMAAARAIWEFFSERVQLRPLGRRRLRRSVSTSRGRPTAALTYPCPDELLPRHPPASPPSHGNAARARARVTPVPRRRRDAALRVPRRGCRAVRRRASRGSLSAPSTRSCGRQRSCRRSACAPCSSSGSRRRRTRRDRVPGRPTGSSSGRCGRSRAEVPGADADDRRVSLRVPERRPLRRARATGRSRTTRRSSCSRGRLRAMSTRAPTSSRRAT